MYTPLSQHGGVGMTTRKKPSSVVPSCDLWELWQPYIGYLWLTAWFRNFWRRGSRNNFIFRGGIIFWGLSTLRIQQYGCIYELLEVVTTCTWSIHVLSKQYLNMEGIYKHAIAALPETILPFNDFPQSDSQILF